MKKVRALFILGLSTVMLAACSDSEEVIEENVETKEIVVDTELSGKEVEADEVMAEENMSEEMSEEEIEFHNKYINNEVLKNHMETFYHEQIEPIQDDLSNDKIVEDSITYQEGEEGRISQRFTTELEYKQGTVVQISYELAYLVLEDGNFHLAETSVEYH